MGRTAPDADDPYVSPGPQRRAGSAPPAPPQHGRPYGGAPYSAYGSPPPHYGAQHDQPQHAQYGPGYGPAQHPASALVTAAARLRAAGVLLWVLQLVWLLLLGGGGALLSAGTQVDDVYGTNTVLDTGDALAGLGGLLYLGSGVAVWALVALWTCHVARACSAAGNGVLGKAGSAWWGLFVPLAGLLLPMLAHREAAAYVVAGERVGGPGQGRGPWWRQERVPGLLPVWWGLWAAAAVTMFLAVGTSDEPATGGALFLVTGLLGIASSLCGAVVLRQLARSTAVCSSASWG